MRVSKKKLTKISKELENIVADMKDMTMDLEVKRQVERLDKVSDDLSTLVQGAGTGRNSDN